jgi:hypothetical protein
MAAMQCNGFRNYFSGNGDSFNNPELFRSLADNKEDN